MATHNDYLPRKEAVLLEWADNFIAQARQHAAEWQIPTGEIDGIARLQAEFRELHQECAGPNRTRALVARKREKKQAMCEKIRAMVKFRFSNPAISDAQRVRAGVHVRDRVYTSHGAPATRPEFDLRDKDFRQLRVDFWDQGSPRKARPYGVGGAVVCYAVLGSPPAGQEQLAKSLLATRTPCTLEFAEEERGKTVYVALQWQSTKGRKGPFSEIQSAVVP